MPNGDFNTAVLAWFRANVEQLNEGVHEVGVKAGENIAAKTKEYISTRGTAKSGKRGRIETEAMLNSVDSRVTEDTDEVLEVRAGYRDTPYYTVFQELGTSRIEAMYALTDASEEELRELPKKIAQAVNNV